MKHSNHLKLIFLVFAIVITGNQALLSQPNLNFKRVTVNGPTIELWAQIGCNGLPLYGVDKSHLHIYEDGIEIKDFTWWSPPLYNHCSVSLALVFDGSANMALGNPKGTVEERLLGHALVDTLDGVIDEASVIWFNDSIAISQEMNTITPVLHDAINTIPSFGRSALMDGVYLGLTDLIANGVNQCRAVIVFASGVDSRSSLSSTEVLSLANRYRLRIFTVAVGASKNMDSLASLALGSGGRFYVNADTLAMDSIYQIVSTSTYSGDAESYASYQSFCLDGTARKVDFSIVDVCGGSDTKSKTFHSVRDTTTFTPITITLDTTSAFGNEIVQLPLLLGTKISGEYFFPASFTIMFVSTQCEFMGIMTPHGSLLDSVPITVMPIAGGVTFFTTQKKLISETGPLAFLSFKTKVSHDTMHCALALEGWQFSAGCFAPVLHDGGITIFPGIASAAGDICEATKFRLAQNYPNPIAANVAAQTNTTVIEYELPSSTHVRLALYDLLGRELLQIVNEFQIAGKHQAALNAGNFPPGMYVYRIETPDFSRAMKMVISK